MRYIETVIKVEVLDEGTSMDEVVSFVQAEAENVAGLARENLDVGKAHAWTSRHEQVTG